MEEKLKHLEFIQNIITRMNSCSFQIKNWTVLVLAAVSVLSIDKKSISLAVCGIFVTVIFWILDGFYLSQERQYRSLYSERARNYSKSSSEIDFSLDASNFNIGRNTWIQSICSNTLIPFYLSILVLSFLILLTLMFPSIID